MARRLGVSMREAGLRLTYKNPMTRLCPAYDLHSSMVLRHGAKR
jgi:hypothetical protein